MNILIQFPTFNRPEKFFKCFEKYIRLSSGKHQLHFNINCEQDDSQLHGYESKLYLIDKLCVEEFNHIKMSLNVENYGNKIAAINANVDSRDFDIVLCASDDMIPQVENWDDEICQAMIDNFPNLDGCVHFNDGYSNGNLITFSILGKQLYDYFGYIYHPDYKSLYCDNEFTQEVIKLGKVKYIDKIIIKHEHYAEQGNSNSGDYDLAAKKTLFYSGRDKMVFELREKYGFPKQRITND
jgi:hypothetical protein